MEKACKECGETKPTDEFHRDRSKPDGLNFYCKVCARTRTKRFMMRPSRYPITDGNKRCSRCKTWKPIVEFHNSTMTADSLDRRCKACCFALAKAWREKNLARSATYMQQYRKDNVERMQDIERKKNYGVPHGWYKTTLAAQGGKCAVCRATTAGGRGAFHVDHCHSSGKIRGLLCHHCNLLMGHAQDRVSVLQDAIWYLLKHS